MGKLFSLFLLFTIYCSLFTNCFAWSTRTYTTDSDFSYFTRDGIDIVGTGDDAKLIIFHNWEKKTPVSASARYSSAMSYDVIFSSAVLFSGRNDSGEIADLWIYSPSNNSWSQKSIEVSP
ncbi:MAG: hypothetical protein ACK4JE_02990, partial [Endomicrobiia bacterium]